MDYYKLLNEYIEKSRLSHRELSRRCKEQGKSVSQAYISQLVRGDVPPASEEVNVVISKVTEGDPERLNWFAELEKGPSIVKKITESLDGESLSYLISLQNSFKKGLISEKDVKDDPEYKNLGIAIQRALMMAEKEGLVKTYIAKDGKLQKVLDGEEPLTDDIIDVLKSTLTSFWDRLVYNLDGFPDLINQYRDELSLHYPTVVESDYDGDFIQKLKGSLDYLEPEILLYLLRHTERFILKTPGLKNPIREKQTSKMDVVHKEDPDYVSLYITYLRDAKRTLMRLIDEGNVEGFVRVSITSGIMALELRLNEILLKAIVSKGLDEEFGLDYLNELSIKDKLHTPLEKYLDYNITEEPFYGTLMEAITLRNRIAYESGLSDLSVEKAKTILNIVDETLFEINKRATEKGII